MSADNMFDVILNNCILKPLRLKKKEVCLFLGFSESELRKISSVDEKFPKALKAGKTRQSGVYYDFNEIMLWKETHLQ
ncbi:MULTISPECIES: AlpA family transcriptional regulator [Acinetobacter]|uniref:AlpA family transcriptional regulator n=1 Tax=Acinetobacter TaxID=469 RepID=UPI0015D3B551|nr:MULTISPECIES: AlpA family transcriptional regulator [Acinetobacter]MCA4813433.1 AlpA family transcriptional regulator [Acinetobacter towneri]MDM1721351.1 AlpA family transcriptional regulator [Acinetobacter towneri]MEB6564735.1 AlpA family transcriptional regulator [Acinetobacter towneri]